MITMPDLKEMITVTQAVDLANGRYTRQHIARAARSGDIGGSVMIGRTWLLPRDIFKSWLSEPRKPGPKSDL